MYQWDDVPMYQWDDVPMNSRNNDNPMISVPAVVPEK
jgi:hypothetical protein